jgi:hypothetical protein
MFSSERRANAYELFDLRDSAIKISGSVHKMINPLHLPYYLSRSRGCSQDCGKKYCGNSFENLHCSSTIWVGDFVVFKLTPAMIKAAFSG